MSERKKYETDEERMEALRAYKRAWYVANREKNNEKARVRRAVQKANDPYAAGTAVPLKQK